MKDCGRGLCTDGRRKAESGGDTFNLTFSPFGGRDSRGCILKYFMESDGFQNSLN